MGRRIIILIIALASTTSCLLVDPYESKVEEEVVFAGNPAEEIVPGEFSWETMVYRDVEILNSNTTVYNCQNEIIADGLPMGKYRIAVNGDDSIQCIQNTYVSFSASPRSEGENTISFPSEDGMGTFMVEDLFPYQGDMDFNDIVFSFSIKYYLTAGNNDKVSKMTVKISPKAMGGNSDMVGIGLKFNDLQGRISKVSGASLEGSNFTDMAENGTENGQSHCTVVPLIGDMRSLFATGEGFLNTFVSLENVSSSSSEITIEFEQGYYPDYSSVVEYIGSADVTDGVSFFVTVDSRSKEIFTKGNTPTDKFDYSLFKNTGREDFSNEENFVWAIQNASEIAYPQEMVSIYEAYPSFNNWVNSLGNEDKGWYKSPETGKIFNFAI